MSARARLVKAETDHPLREAVGFTAVVFLIAAGVYLPLFASDRGWIDITLPQGLLVLGVLSPGIAALFIRLYDDGVDGLRSVFSGLGAWRFGRAWWGVTIALPPAFATTMAGVYNGLGHDFFPAPIRLLTEAGIGIVPLIVLLVVGAAGEEVGWRGHLLPLLQARLNALSASLVLAVIWAVWHVPLFIGIDGWALPLRLVSIFGGAVMYTWLFNNTGGSVLAVTLLHFGHNFWGRLLFLSPTETSAAAAFTAVNLLFAVVLIGVFGGATLADRPSLPGR